MKLEDALKNVSHLGLDTAVFIYFVERNPNYVDLTREIFRRVTDGEFAAFSSVITLTEVLVQPLRQNNRGLTNDYRDLLLDATNFQLINLDSSIAETAAELRANYNLRTPDALQIASVLACGCEAFLCNDKRLKAVKELRVLILDDLSR